MGIYTRGYLSGWEEYTRGYLSGWEVSAQKPAKTGRNKGGFCSKPAKNREE